MKKLNLYLFFALGLLAFTSQAQISLNNISVGASYWNRTYEGPDERYFLISYEEDGNFSKGAIMPHFSAEVNLFRGLAVDARVGYWAADFETSGRFGDLRVSEKIEQTIIPVSVGLLYRMNNLVHEDFNLYLGAGINRYFVQNKISRQITGGEGVGAEDSFNGNNYGANGKAGIEYFFTPSLGLALEGRYNAGFYNQTFRVETNSDPIREQVSVQGFEVGLSLRYRFNAGDGASATTTPAAPVE